MQTFSLPFSVYDGLSPLPKSGIVYIAGVFELLKPLVIDGAKDLTLIGLPGAGFKKAEGFAGTALLSLTNGENVRLEGLDFTGKTTSTEDPALIKSWGDDGVFAPAIKGLTVQNCRFENFGDAAIRSTSTLTVTAENILIEHNHFQNVTQVTTTNNNGGGGAQGYRFQHNTVRGLKGSIKLASRQPGAGPAWVLFNDIQGSPTISMSHGVEIVSFGDVLVFGNNIHNQGFDGAGVTIKNNDRTASIPFGNIRVDGNTIKDGNMAVYYQKGIPGISVGTNSYLNMKKTEVQA